MVPLLFSFPSLPAKPIYNLEDSSGVTHLPHGYPKETLTHITCLACWPLPWTLLVSPWQAQPRGVCWCPQLRHDMTLPTREADRGQGSETESKGKPNPVVRGWVTIKMETSAQVMAWHVGECWHEPGG